MIVLSTLSQSFSSRVSPPLSDHTSEIRHKPVERHATFTKDKSRSLMSDIHSNSGKEFGLMVLRNKLEAQEEMN